MGEARVALVGCGALGTFHAAALARAGAGFLRIIDRDYVEWNNLQRQWLFDEADAAEGLPKAVAASRHLATVNSTITIDAQVADLTPATIDDLLEDCHLILDGTDNFETRYLINDYAVREGVPWIYGGAVGSYGVVMPILPGRTCCLKCLYPSPPAGIQPTCETAGVLNTAPAMVASWQISLALRIVTGSTADLKPRLTMLDVWTGEVRQIAQPDPQPGCSACGLRDFVHLEGRRHVPISLCGRNAVQIHERARPLDLAALREQLQPLGTVKANEFALRFFLDPYEMTIFPDGRAIIKGTTDIGLARSLYARYVGG